MKCLSSQPGQFYIYAENRRQDKCLNKKQEVSPSEWPVSSFLPAVCSRYEGLACSFWHTAGVQSHSCLSSPVEDQLFKILTDVPASWTIFKHSAILMHYCYLM